MKAYVLAASAFILLGGGDKDALREALQDTAPAGAWIYDDLPAGFAEAARTGKPLLVVLRCVP